VGFCVVGVGVGAGTHCLSEQTSFSAQAEPALEHVKSPRHSSMVHSLPSSQSSSALHCATVLGVGGVVGADVGDFDGRRVGFFVGAIVVDDVGRGVGGGGGGGAPSCIISRYTPSFIVLIAEVSPVDRLVTSGSEITCVG